MAISIRPARAVGVLAVLAIIAITVSVTLLLWDLRTRAVEHGQEETASVARMLAQQVAQSFGTVEAGLSGIVDRLDSPFIGQLGLDSVPIHLLLSSRLPGMEGVSALTIADSRGVVVNSTGIYPATPRSVADRAYFRVFARRGAATTVIDAPIRDRSTGGWRIHVARPFRNPDGTLRGVVVASVRVSALEKLFATTRLDVPRPVALYLDDGRLLASVPPRDDAIGEPAAAMRGIALPPPGVVRRYTQVGAGSSDDSFVVARVAGLPLSIGVGDNTEQTLAAWRATAVPIGAGAALVILFIGGTALLLALELQRKEALDRALRDADRRYRRTIDSAMDAIVSVDAQQNIVMFNPAAERMFGIPSGRAIGSPVAALIPQRLLPAAGGAEGSAGTVTQTDLIALRADGSAFPVESAVSQVEVDGAMQLTAVLRDVTERRRRETELRAMNEELRRLSMALQSVREEERARISRELHDDLGQQLTGLKLDLSWMAGRLKDGRPPVPDAMDSMRRLLDGAIAAVRRISTELRPRILDDLDFSDAVSWQVGEFAKRSPIAIGLDIPAADRVSGDALATALFRIVQESLTNVVRHAGATRVDIRLVETAEGLRLTIADDGCGFDAGRKGTRGIGLVSMRERATALGGRFRIIATPGGGTTIEVDVPLTDAAADAVEPIA